MCTRIRVVVLLMASCWLLIAASAFAENAVFVENISVLPNATNVVIHVRITNDVSLRAVIIPLYVTTRSISGAFITGATLNFDDRLAAIPFEVTAARQLPQPDGSSCECITCFDDSRYKTVSGSGTGVKFPVVAMPEGFLFIKSSFSTLLPAGSDVTGSIKLTVDVGSQAGLIFVDTACVDPQNHLSFVNEGFISIAPSFYQGSITVESSSGCCVGTTGNVNMSGIVNSLDLAMLIQYLTPPAGPALPCSEEANVNATGIINSLDLAFLIQYLTPPTGPDLPNCP